MADKNLNDIYITNIPAVRTTNSGQMRLSAREVEQELIEFFSNLFRLIQEPFGVITKMTIPDKVANHPDTYIGFMRISRPESHKTIVESYALSKFKSHFLCLGWSTKAPSYSTPHQSFTSTKSSTIFEKQKISQTNETPREETEPLDRLSTLIKNKQKLDNEIRAERCQMDLAEREKQITKREKELIILENEMKQKIAKVKSDRAQIKEWGDALIDLKTELDNRETIIRRREARLIKREMGEISSQESATSLKRKNDGEKEQSNKVIKIEDDVID